MSDVLTVSLETVFDAIPVGLNIVDSARRIVLMNRAFREALGLPQDAFPPGTRVEDAVRASALRGVFGPGDPEAQVAAVLAADHSRPGRLHRWMFAGRSHDLYNTPLDDGGYVVSVVETTSLLAARADAETALSQTATALTTLRIGLAMFGSDRRLLLANPRFASLLSVPTDRLVAGISFEAMLALMESREEFASPDGTDFISLLRDRAFGPRWSTRRQRADGRSIDVMSDPLPDGGCTIAVSDITPQAQAEDEARRRARLLDLVLLNVPHGICVYGPDRRVAMFNDTYNKVMQGAPLQVGDTMVEVIRRRAEAGEYGAGDPDTVFHQQMAHDIGRPQMRRRVRPNGTAIDVRTAPLPDGGHISVVTDISALVHAESELRRRAEDMATMLDNIRQGIMLWGPDRRLVASNPVAAILMDLPPDVLLPGRTEAEVLAALSQIGHFGSPGEFAPAAQQLLDLDRSVPFGREVTTRSGRILFAQSNPAPGGGWISTFSDITLMRRAEQELRRAKELAEAANLAKSRFLATMSHELRTPLNAIIGFSDALARENGDVPAALVAEYSGQINDAGKQLLSLINIILDVARIESGRFDPHGEVVDIAKSIQAAVRQSENAAQAGEVSVATALPEDLPSLRADERHIVQALSQLVSNAVKFTEAGGSVTVEAGVTPSAEVFVSVTDTGIGIPDTDLERVFEPFTQLDGSLSRRYPGAGVGLFMARAIVAAHGGQLMLNSRPGQGTVARLTLPGSRIVNQSPT
jgi:signal transduction histidine kinase